MKKLILYTCCIIALMACKKDFVVENIDNKTITVNGPGNNLETTNNVITFWWDLLDGAEKYNLQIVTPSFAKVAQLVLDTNITTNKFNFSLQPGSYQWRIKATNAGHATSFQTFNLKIDTTNNLSSLLVNMLNPVNNLVTGNKVVTFNWSAISGANKYELQINAGALKDTIVNGTSVTCTLPAVANATTAFTWNVKGIGDYNQTQYNATPFSFTVDLKPPTAPSLSTPAFGASVKDTVKLVWIRSGTDVAYDSVYVADDSTFTNVISQQWSDVPNIRINALSISPNTGNSFYWWRVRSFDAVGNRSSFNGKLKFKLIP